MRRFLRAAKAALASPASPKCFVVGNEAGDADSIVGALVLGLALHNGRIPFTSVALSQHPGVEIVPIVSCNREDFVLRQDSVNLLERYAHVTASDLIFVDDLATAPTPTPNSASSSCVILVDHNRLDTASSKVLQHITVQPPGDDSPPHARVAAIVDHHSDEGRYDHVQASARYIDMVGSACSLLASMILKDDPDMMMLLEEEESAGGAEGGGGGGGAEVATETTNIAALLAAVITVDTSNLNAKERIFKQIDVDTLGCLRAILAAGSGGTNSVVASGEEVLAEMLAWRASVDNLTPAQLLRKDFKLYEAPRTAQQHNATTYGISMVPLSIAASAGSDDGGGVEALAEAIRSNIPESAMVMVMFGYTDEENRFQRELVVHTRPSLEPLFQRLVPEFLPVCGAGFVVHESEVARQLRDNHGLACFTQQQVTWSRKVLQPAIHEWLAGV